MILINLFFMNSITGMSYYSLDYLECLKKENFSFTLITSNKIVSNFFKEKFPDSEIFCTNNFLKFTIFLIKFRFLYKKFFIYTPTSHPIPLIKNQIVILHDIYVFKDGIKGKIKEFLFKISLYSSSSKVGFINRSISGKFLEKINCESIFLPNLYKNIKNVSEIIYLNKINKLKIALTGTSCLKKNHQNILQNEIALNKKLFFYLYGDNTKYSEYLIKKFSYLNLGFIDSNYLNIRDFLKEIDILIVQNKYEGFCRPILIALTMGKLVIAPKAEIYNEFYKDCIINYGTKDELINILAKILNNEFSNKKNNRNIVNKRNTLFKEIECNSIKGEKVFLQLLRVYK